MMMMSLNLQSGISLEGRTHPLCRARPHAMCKAAIIERGCSMPTRTCSPIRVLTIRDMLSHVRRRGHLALRGVTISVGGRLVTLGLALLVSRQGFCRQPAAHMK